MIQHIFCIDSHAEGEPNRIVIGPLLWKRCTTMSEKRDYFKSNYDYIRKALINEPKGHNDMYGTVICEPCCESADLGALYIDSEGTLDLCGHGTIATVTSLIELGIIPSNGEKDKVVVVDTAAGPIRTVAHISGDKVDSVTLRNNPCFVYKKGCELLIANGKSVHFDIAFSGNYFASIPIEQFGIGIELKNAGHLVSLGMDILNVARESFEIVHPGGKYERKIEEVNFFQFNKETKEIHTCIVFGSGQMDRSPSGTGTTATMATLYEYGLLEIGREYTATSTLGTSFKCKALEKTDFFGYDAIIPEVTGHAYCLGTQQFFLDERDPFVEGFKIPR
ncbi:MAG: proline racemase family protein [Synergistaceae bacterium]|nr:proline racemase family protein [Synergistaceae bacterium]